MNIQAIQNLNPEGLHGVNVSLNNINHIWASLDFVDSYSANNFFDNLKKLYKANGKCCLAFSNIHKRWVNLDLTVLSRLEVK